MLGHMHGRKDTFFLQFEGQESSKIYKSEHDWS